MLHGMNAGVGFLAFLNLTLFGIFMGLLFVRYENIWVVAAVHSIWNFLQGNVFGIQVSGSKIQPSLFTSDLIKGRELINGGSFGAEGGLAVTLVLLFAGAVLVWNMSKEGYFIQAEPVVNPYDKMVFRGYVNQDMPVAPGSSYVQKSPEAGYTKSHENMGVNPQETPWHPKEEPAEKNITGFDETYFKD